MLEAALDAADAGLSVVPPRQDGSKAPARSWKTYQTTPADTTQLEAWYGDGTVTGLGVVCGQVSGGLELVEFEGRAIEEGLWDQYLKACVSEGLGDVIGRVTEGYLDRSPSGGARWLWRCPEIESNLKLARRPSTPDELDADPDNKIQVLIETRGEGGYAVIPPSHGDVHATGRPWEQICGGFATIATVTPHERRQLLDLARRFDQIPDTPAPKPAKKTADSEDRPLDRFDREHTCEEVLETKGFTLAYTDSRGSQWTRPGKDRRHGTSATVWADNGTCSLWSTSIDCPPEFIGNRQLRPSQALTALFHSGDFGAAAAAVAGNQDGPDLSWAEGHDRQEPVAGEELTRRYTPGGTWILDAPEHTEAIWGTGTEVAWAAGESLFIAAPPGVGKTTLALQLVLARLGLLPDVLGWPVAQGQRVLYLAMDRPRQIQRAFRRIVTPDHRDTLNDQLIIWQGPPPADFASDPTILTQLAAQVDADTIFIDSLKDGAIKLAEDETGGAVNRALQTATAEGLELCVLHHQRKSQAGSKPKALADVYGSTWITAGAGSVILLWGEAGDLVVELNHLKQPDEPIGPLKIQHDHDRGVTTIVDQVDLVALAANAPHGLTVQDAARALYEKTKVERNDIEKARRRLERLVTKGKLIRGHAPQLDGGKPPSVYRAAAVDWAVENESREQSRSEGET